MKCEVCGFPVKNNGIGLNRVIDHLITEHGIEYDFFENIDYSEGM